LEEASCTSEEDAQQNDGAIAFLTPAAAMLLCGSPIAQLVRFCIGPTAIAPEQRGRWLERPPRSTRRCGRGRGEPSSSTIAKTAPTHGDEPTREAAMAAFAKSWRRE
jgi:hypothetical protein